MIRVIICGGRHCVEQEAIDGALDRVLRKHPGFTLIHGGTQGVALLASLWAASRSVATECHPAATEGDHDTNEARRNQYMLELGTDAVVAFPGEASTADMVRRAEAAGVPVWRVGWPE